MSYVLVSGSGACVGRQMPKLHVHVPCTRRLSWQLIFHDPSGSGLAWVSHLGWHSYGAGTPQRNRVFSKLGLAGTSAARHSNKESETESERARERERSDGVQGHGDQGRDRPICRFVIPFVGRQRPYLDVSSAQPEARVSAAPKEACSVSEAARSPKKRVSATANSKIALPWRVTSVTSVRCVCKVNPASWRRCEKPRESD
ncbi:hypothetical protein EV126DRAFT_135578 [Verticillium dahliae]|nr:hypothetical protein EV126DRAFT_135578 [Verticillium dahliae]